MNSLMHLVISFVSELISSLKCDLVKISP
uniref:Uncharacterized protein n=1 Tax=Anguilla anguilla TaxID=7936 RepID=A0A0E9XNB6_ANGAN